jgi:hypothetical protein
MNNNRKGQKGFRIVLICILVTSLFFILNNSNQDKIIRLVKNNIEFLNESINKVDYDQIYKIKGVKMITPYDLEDNVLYIDFYCYGFGIVPSSTYSGFYYVSTDKPIGFQGVPIKLESDGYGWKWREPDGDNWYYTEKVEDHWYYYKAGF